MRTYLHTWLPRFTSLCLSLMVFPLVASEGGFSENPSPAEVADASQDSFVSGYRFRPPTYLGENLRGKPVPSNDWWTHLLVDRNTKTMSAFPLHFGIGIDQYPAEDGGWGLAIDAKERGKLVGDWKVTGDTVSSLLVFGDDMLQNQSYAELRDFGDWHIDVTLTDGTRSIRNRLLAGSPFSYHRFYNTNPKIRLNSWGGFIDFYDINGNKLLNQESDSIRSDHLVMKLSDPKTREVSWWAIFAPEDTRIKRSRYFLSFELGDDNYLAIAHLPSQSDAGLFYQHAYAEVLETRVSYNVNDKSQEITTSFQIDSKSTRPGFSSEPMIALFPHQYKNLHASYRIEDLRFPTMRGEMRGFIGNEFKTVLRNYGLIPVFNEPTGSQSYDPAKARQWMLDEQYVRDYYNVGTYGAGQAMLRAALSLNLADKLQGFEFRDELMESLYREFEDWFTYDPGKEERFWLDNGQHHFMSYFPPEDNDWGRLVGWRSEFGTTALNDGMFHYGYWIYAASILAMHHPSFVEDYGWAIDEIIRHIASPDRSDPRYPWLRHFNPYTGRSYASGWYWDDNFLGNDLESTSECLNAWQAIFQWGQITGQKKYQDLGLYLFWTEKSAVDQYWLDVDKDILHPDYKKGHVVILREAAYEYNTHWGNDQIEWLYGIQMKPITPATTYLGLNQTYARQFYDKMGGDFDRWHGIMLKYLSLFDPQEAIEKFEFGYMVGGPGGFSPIHSHETWSLVYNFIHNMNQLGHPSADFYADHPSFGIFKKSAAEYNFVVFNPKTSSEDVSIYSMDGRLVHTAQDLAPKETRYITYLTGAEQEPQDPIDANQPEDPTVPEEAPAAKQQWDATMPNGIIDGGPLSYRTSIHVDEGVATITFEGGEGFDWVWLFTPGHNNLERVGNIWQVSIGPVYSGQRIEWSFTVRKNGTEANNRSQPHHWVIP